MIQWRLGVAFVQTLHGPVGPGLRASLLMLNFIKKDHLAVAFAQSIHGPVRAGRELWPLF